MQTDRARSPLSRRLFLGQLAAAPLLPAVPGLLSLAAGGEETGFQRRIVRQTHPDNLEFAFDTLDGFVIPNERFYVRSHFAVPLAKDAWRLRVEGAVKNPLTLTFDELVKLPARTQTALLECAGNGRVFLTPRARGVAWELGAVSNAEWAGVPLAAVLERAGVRDRAVEVVLEGADSGAINDDPRTPGVIHFARGIPLEKALRPEVLLAHRMNGQELPRAHGHPLRAVVPGWYGMASVKWLTRIVVTDRPFQGYFQTMDYTYFERRNGLPEVTPIGELSVKAQIARPAIHEVVAAGSTYRAHGAAWTGESEVRKVEVSGDGGKSWAEAKLLDKAVPFAWRLWEYSWKVPAKAGPVTLLARATDARGLAQPLERRDQDRRTYMISHVLPIEVEVR